MRARMKAAWEEDTHGPGGAAWRSHLEQERLRSRRMKLAYDNDPDGPGGAPYRKRLAYPRDKKIAGWQAVADDSEGDDAIEFRKWLTHQKDVRIETENAKFLEHERILKASQDSAKVAAALEINRKEKAKREKYPEKAAAKQTGSRDSNDYAEQIKYRLATERRTAKRQLKHAATHGYKTDLAIQKFLDIMNPKGSRVKPTVVSITAQRKAAAASTRAPKKKRH